jgi:sugar phosphate isomerase/epimerase
MGEVLSNKFRLGLQLWTVRELAERDLAGALMQVRDAGYDAIEIFGDGPAFFEDMRAALQRSGLACCSAHVPFLALRNDLPRVITGLHAIGCNTAVVPAFAKDLRDTQPKALQLSIDLNRIGERLGAAGIAFAYHNEDYDFTPLHEGGASLWQTLADNTDGSLVQLQLDIFTATLMGADPIGMMRDHGRRITSLHVCDMREGKYVPVGQGTLDWPALLSAASHTAAQWVIVEHDAPATPIADAAASLNALRNLLKP